MNPGSDDIAPNVGSEPVEDGTAEGEVSPPVETLARVLPFFELDWPVFEDLCLALAERRGEVEHAQRYGDPGQKQDGIDVYARLADGDYYVFQSRRVREMGPADIKSAVREFVESPWFEPASTFVLCTTASLTSTARADEVERQARRLKADGKVFLPWGLETLSEQLRQEGDLVRRFFSRAWEQAFCDPGPTPDGEPKPLWKMRDQMRVFGGREAELADVDTAVARQREAFNGAAIALHGLGGVGKTQLAAAWAERHREDFDVGLWVSASEPVVGRAALAAFSRELGLSASPAEEESLASLHEALRAQDRWLVVLDDLSNPAELARLLPTSRGTVLVTTRHFGGWRGTGVEPIQVGTWAPEDAVAYLVAVSGDGDETAAASIAERLGHLPLAVAQAASYVETTGTSLAQYLGLLKDAGLSLLDQGSAPDYAETVRTTWQLAFEDIETRPPAGDLLGAVAYLAPSGISRRLLEEVALTCGSDAVALDAALGDILSFSLLTPQDGGVVMHALVSMAVRDRLDAAEHFWRAVEATLVLMPEGYSSPEAREEGKDLIENVLALAEHAATAGHCDVPLVHLLRRGAHALTANGDLRAARALYAQELPLAVEVFGPDAIEVARLLNDFGSVLRDLGQLADAREQLAHSLALKKAAAPGTLLVASSANNLAQVEQALGEKDAARALMEEALALIREDLGEDHPEFAMQLSNVGTLVLDDDDPDASRLIFEQALEILGRSPEDTRANEAMVRSNLGNAMLDLFDPERAIEEQKRALALKKELYDPPHPTLADTIANLANALLADGQLEASLRHHDDALAMTEEAYGPTSQAKMRSLYNRANTLEALERLEEAEAVRAEANQLADNLGIPRPRTGRKEV